jgi:hypothetical protein
MGSQSILQPHRLFVCLLATLIANAAFAQTLATTVPLVRPSAIAYDSQGNLYLAETANHVIRRVDTAGHITTVAGTGTQGFDGDGGQASVALLDSPQGLAVNSSSLYIADTHNHRIRKVDLSSGVITTIAGSSNPGSTGDNGPATSATLDTPTALTLDTQRNLYLADIGSHRIRKIAAATGIINTVAGTGTQGFEGEGSAAAAALIDSPGGLAVDSNGNLYLADTHNQRVRRIDAVTGAITTVAGIGAQGFSGDSNAARTAQLSLPQGLSIDAQGNVYVTDTANHRIRRVDGSTGKITTIAGDGTQAFSGDGGDPTAASLNSPRSTSLSPSGTVTIADTGNQRIRQIASDVSLQTIAGLGAITPGVLTLSGPAVISYGGGKLIATLNSATDGVGNVTFFDSYSGASSTAANIRLSANAAVFDTSALPAGQHAITATYVGDASHPAAQTSTFALTVSPRPLTASITPSSITYGEAVPPFTGTLNGVLPRDQSSVSATFATTAAILSPAGTYPITITLSGAAAGNYTIATPPSLTITPAATTTTLIASAPGINSGQSATLTTHTVSQTTGVPTGTVTIFDGASILTTGKISATGDLVFTTSTLTAGSHNLTASYSGDSNFHPSTSSALSLTVNAPQTNSSDFVFTPTSVTTQIIVSGASVSFTFNAQLQGSFSSPISLAASGLPNLATASFNPPYIPPGYSNATFTLTIATPKTARLERARSIIFALLFTPLTAIFFRRRLPRLLAVLLVASPLIFATGCGDRIYTGNVINASKTYTITITGTATSPTGAPLQHAATVTLVVVPPS